MTFKSSTFEVRNINIGGDTEQVVEGGRNLFQLLPKGFKGIKQIGVIGWGSQGPAQAQNLRDSLKDTDIKVVVGLRSNSKSMNKAREAGFTKTDNSLGEMFDVIRNSDLVLLLISDAAQTQLYKDIFSALKPGATLGVSHGYLLGHMKNVGDKWPQNHNIIMVAPKGMGPSVRRLYVQGEKVDGAGINASFAVEQDVDGIATDTALSWAVALGSPFAFETTMESEYRSDIFGERAILLGGIWGLSEALYRYFISRGDSKAEAFNNSVESITGPITKIISHDGLLALFQAMESDEDKYEFIQAYSASYPEAMAVMREIYDEVYSGNEIRSVNMAGERLKQRPMGSIDGTEMWQVGKDVRSARNTENQLEVNIDPFTAGAYTGAMMAQIDLLIEKGHSWSEICNESVIEAVDSLNPYMKAQGVAYMVDNCSRTARLGTRKWGPIFDYAFTSGSFVAVDNKTVNVSIFSSFEEHPIHEALAVCAELRPSVDISVN